MDILCILRLRPQTGPPLACRPDLTWPRLGDRCCSNDELCERKPKKTDAGPTLLPFFILSWQDCNTGPFEHAWVKHVPGGCFPQLGGHFSNVVVWDNRCCSVSLFPSQCFLPIMLFGHYVVSVPWDDSYKGFPTKGPNLVFGLPCRSQTCHPQPCHICHGVGLARDTKENMCREAVRVNHRCPRWHYSWRSA